MAETYTMSGVTVQVKNFEFSEDQRYGAEASEAACVAKRPRPAARLFCVR